MGEIKGTQIIQDNHLANAIAQAEKYLATTKENTAAIVEMSKAMKEMLSSNKMSSAKDFNDIAKAMKEAGSMLKQYNDYKKDEARIEKDLQDVRTKKEKADQQAIRTEREKLKLTVETNKEKDRQAKADAKLLAEEKRLNSEYSKQSKALNDLRNKYKDLILVQGKETAESRKMLAEITKLDAKLKAVDASVGQGQRTVGLYTDGINKAKVGVLNFASALGVVTGVQLFTNALKGAFNIVKENEDAFASLSAITGLTGDKFTVFETAINATAERLKVSSTDVAEAAEKIASAQPKLLENADALAGVTEQAIILNKAIKGDLTETSLALVGVMNQFNLGAEESARIINILAAGSQAGAADVNQVNESMVKFGTTAKILNVSVEESVGLIETLGEKAIFGSEAGTALKNVMLIMSSIDVLPPKALKQLEKYGVDTNIVKDTTISFSERLKELSKIGSDTTAIMQVFGKENATAATVLLNSTDTLDHMTAAVTGTSVAQEQMAINSDTLSNVILELKAAWENLVLKWSNGAGVGETLKDVLRFIADNLESIINWVVRGVKAWVLYKSMLTLVNKEGTGMIQMFSNLAKGVKGASFNLGTFAKGLGGILGIAAVLVPMFIDVVKSIGEMINRTTALDKVTEKFNSRMDDEHAKMEVLRVKIFQTNAGSAERKKLIDEINGTYGTTLQNLEDEAAFMLQLEDAYKKVNAQMEERIQKQLIEEELTNAFREKRRGEAMKRANEESRFAEGSIGVAELIIKDAEDDIRMLQQELFRLNNQLDETGKKRTHLNRNRPTNETDIEANANKTVDVEKQKLDRLNALRQKHAADLVLFENEAIKMGYDRDTIDQLLFMRKKELLEEELVFIKELNLKTREEYDKTENARLKMIEEMDKRIETSKIERLEGFKEEVKAQNYMLDAMVAAQKKIVDEAQARKKEMEEAIKQTMEMAKKLVETITEINNARINKIDNEIQQRQTEKGMHEERISEMKDLAREGVLTAEESIKAEENQVAKIENEIKELERKKQKLLTVNLGLQTALNLAEAGDANAIANSLGKVGSFVKNLGSFKKGTDRTGSGNIDADGGHLAILHPNEMIMQAPLTKGLYERGLTREDTAMFAMRYHDEMVNGAALENGSFSDVMTLAKLNEISMGQKDIANAIKNQKFPEYKQDYDVLNQAFIQTIKTNNEIKRYIKEIR